VQDVTDNRQILTEKTKKLTEIINFLTEKIPGCRQQPGISMVGFAEDAGRKALPPGGGSLVDV
jgi:hypothetical protein